MTTQSSEVFIIHDGGRGALSVSGDTFNLCGGRLHIENMSKCTLGVELLDIKTSRWNFTVQCGSLTFKGFNVGNPELETLKSVFHSK